MKWYRLLALFITFVAALLIGAVVFKYLEETYHPGVPAPETTTTATTTSRPEGDELAVVEDFVSRKNLCVTSEELFELIDAVQQVRSAASINQDFVNNVTENVKNDTRRTPYKIGFFDSFFFCGTIATTIGYGHIYPFTDAGKVFCIAYALVSIPLTLFMLAGIGGKLGNANRWVENRVKRVIRRPYLIRVFMVFFIIIFGLGLFCFVPAYIIMYVEKWSYLDSIYYVFITLSTVGFGDMVVAQNPVKEHWAYDILYKIAVLCWIVVGLSFLATIFDLIAEAMRGLKARLEEEMRQVTDFAEKVGHEAKDLAGKVGKVGSEVAHAASMPVKGIKKMAQGEGSKEKLKEKDEKEKGDKEKGDKEKEKDGKKKGKDDKKKGKDDKKKATTPSEEDAIIGIEGSYKRTGSHENLPELPNGPEMPAQSQEVTTDDQNIPQENGIQMGNIPSKEEAETAKQSQEGQPTEPTNQASSADETAPPDVKKVAAEEPDVTQEVPDVKPEVPKVKPEIPKGKPEVPKGKPEVPKGRPEVKVVMPEVPEVTSVVPEVTPAASEPVTQSNENAAKPEEPEPAKVEHVDETSGAQDKTADAEKDSAAGKDDTAVGAEANETQDSTDKKQEDLDRLI